MMSQDASARRLSQFLEHQFGMAKKILGGDFQYVEANVEHHYSLVTKKQKIFCMFPSANLRLGKTKRTSHYRQARLSFALTSLEIEPEISGTRCCDASHGVTPTS